MAKRENEDARDGIKRFATSLWKRQSPGHDAKSHGSDRSRQNETVLASTPAERDRTDKHRKSQADLVDNRFSKDAAGRREQPQKHCSGDAVNHAKARKPHCYSVQPARLNRHLVHGRTNIGPRQESYNIS